MTNKEINYCPKREIDTPNTFFSSKKSVLVTTKIATVASSIFALINVAPLTTLCLIPALFTINLFTIPTALKYGNSSFAKTVIIVSFVALGSLLVGWGSGSFAAMIKDGFELSTGNIDIVILNALISTLNLGYAIPNGLRYLSQAREMILSETWHEAIRSVGKMMNICNHSPGLSLSERLRTINILVNQSQDLLCKPEINYFFENNFLTSCQIKEKIKKTLKTIEDNPSNFNLQAPILMACLAFLISRKSDDIDECLELIFKNKANISLNLLAHILTKNLLQTRSNFIENKFMTFFQEVKQLDKQEELLDNLAQEFIQLTDKINQAVNETNEEEIKKCISYTIDLQEKFHDLVCIFREFEDKKKFWTTLELNSNEFCWKASLKTSEAINALNELRNMNLGKTAKIKDLTKQFDKIQRLLEPFINTFQSHEQTLKTPSFKYLYSLNIIPFLDLKKAEFLIELEENQDMNLFQHKFNEVGLRTEDDIKNLLLDTPDSSKDLKKISDQLDKKEKQLSALDFTTSPEHYKAVEKWESLQKSVLFFNNLKDESEYENYKVDLRKRVELNINTDPLNSSLSLLETQNHYSILCEKQKNHVEEIKKSYQEKQDALRQEIESLKIKYAEANKKSHLAKLECHFKNYGVTAEDFFNEFCPNILSDKDFQHYLGVSSKEKAIEALANNGLKTKTDLKDKKLLPTDEELVKFFENADLEENNQWTEDHQKDYQKIVIDHLKESTVKASARPTLQELCNKVQGLIYRLITTGLVLVPVYCFAQPALIGLGLGIPYFILSRFGFTQVIDDLKNKLALDQPTFEKVLTYSLSRNIFSMTPTMKKDIEDFSQANFFEKIRFLNKHIIISYIFKFLFPPVGAVVRGFFFGRELVNLV